MKEVENGEVKFYSVAQVAERLGVHKTSIYRRIAAREIEFIRLSPKRVIVSSSALTQFIEEHRIPVER